MHHASGCLTEKAKEIKMTQWNAQLLNSEHQCLLSDDSPNFYCQGTSWHIWLVKQANGASLTAMLQKILIQEKK